MVTREYFIEFCSISLPSETLLPQADRLDSRHLLIEFSLSQRWHCYRYIVVCRFAPPL